MSKSTQHTPGPWKLWDDQPSEWTVRASAGPEYLSGVVATVRVDWIYEHQREQQRANARLIAAAPEMLEALRLVTSTLNARDGHTLAEKLYATKVGRAAIAKAEGGGVS
jgi:hypothetical protein